MKAAFLDGGGVNTREARDLRIWPTDRRWFRRSIFEIRTNVNSLKK
jgi:hypothetical protein